MARCIDCIHESVCSALIKKGLPWNDGEYPAEAFCMAFQNKADVVPKSEYYAVVSAVDNSTNEFLKLHDEYQDAKREVEELTRENESLAKTVNKASELIRKLRSKIDELKKDRYQVLPDGRRELLPRTDIDKIKTEVVREIFEEIENDYADFLFDGLRNVVVITEKDFCELKKKYTEEKYEN